MRKKRREHVECHVFSFFLPCMKGGDVMDSADKALFIGVNRWIVIIELLIL